MDRSIEDHEPSEANTVNTVEVNRSNEMDAVKGVENDFEVTASLFRKPTKKGKEYKMQLCKQSQTTALTTNNELR